MEWLHGRNLIRAVQKEGPLAPRPAHGRCSTPAGANREKATRFFLLALLLFSLPNVVTVVVARYLHLPYPMNTPLFQPWDTGMDLFNPYAVAFDPYGQPAAARWQQMPVFYWVLQAFHCLGPMGAYGFLLMTFWGSVAVIVRRVGIGAFFSVLLFLGLCLTYPALIVVDRANLEMVYFPLIGVFLWACRRRRWAGAALALGASIAFKPFSIFLLPLLAGRPLVRWLALCWGAALFLSALAMMSFPGAPGENLTSWLVNMRMYSMFYEWHIRGAILGHSWFGALKAALFAFGISLPDPTMSSLGQAFQLCGLLVTVVVVALAWSRHISWWAWLTVLLCLMTLTGLVSADYRLIHFLFPLCLLIKRGPEWFGGRHLRNLLMLFAALLAPKGFWHLSGTEVGSSVFLAPVILTLLLAYVLCLEMKPGAAHVEQGAMESA